MWPSQIEITGGSGDAAAGKKPEYKIENAYDGSTQACYIPGTKKNSQAKFQIQESIVDFVRVLNRLDCCR